MQYEVLFYKRTGKVHKSKGVSKADGILVVDNEQGTVLLRRNEEFPANDADDGTSKELIDSKRASGRKFIASKKLVDFVYYGRVSESTRRPLHEDDILILGNFEVLVVRECSENTPEQNVQTKHFGKRPPGTKYFLKKAPEYSVKSIGNGSIPLKRTSLCQTSHALRRPLKSPFRAKKNQKSSESSNPSSPTLSRACSVDPPTVLPHINLQNSIRSALRPHQISGVDFLWESITGTHRGALLADEMGLGKSLMTIAIISALYRQSRQASFVVVCPSSLVGNWKQEFDKWIGPAGQPKRIAVEKGGPDGLRQIRSFCALMKSIRTQQSGYVLIISYDFFRMHTNEFPVAIRPEARHIELLVCDEAHRLKNANGSLTLTALSKLSTKARLALTATPIQNCLNEFFTVANFVSPGVFGTIQEFRRDFERPISKGNSNAATKQERALAMQQFDELDRIIKTFMIRRLQSEVLKQLLPPRTEVLLFCQPSAKQITLYEDVAASSNVEDSTSVLTVLTTLRKIATHPSLHIGQSKQLLSSMRDTVEMSGKMNVLRVLLSEIRKNKPEEKVVVVSNFTSALSMIETMILKPKNFTYVRLDGSTEIAMRQSLVKSFNQTSPETSFCFLLSAKAGGCGLNLVRANRMVILDPDWNPSTDIQSMGRVYRQGQTRPTYFYRLFLGGSLEELILQRQQQKTALSGLAIDGKEFSVGFTKDEIQESLVLKADCRCDNRFSGWPLYRGKESLLEGDQDPPLLNLAEKVGGTLGYVRFMTQNESPDHPSTIEVSRRHPLVDRAYCDDENSEHEL